MRRRTNAYALTLGALATLGTLACGPTPSPGGQGGAGGSGGSGPSNPCSGTSLRGDSSASLVHGGQTRTFLVHAPPSYDGRTPVPLVIDIHGLTSTAGAQAGLSGWRAKADREGFIVVHPQGLGNSWNGGSLCCGSSLSSQVDDVGFMRAIVNRFRQGECVDEKRVYATGLSNGGAMSHKIACDAADMFAATGPVAMGNGARPCNPSRPISVAMFRATNDTLVPYDGGIFPSAQADFDQWKTLNGCTGAPQTVRGGCQLYSSCRGGVEVQLCSVNGGHVLYGAAASQGMPVPDVIWDVFERQTLP